MRAGLLIFGVIALVLSLMAALAGMGNMLKGITLTTDQEDWFLVSMAGQIVLFIWAVVATALACRK